MEYTIDEITQWVYAAFKGEQLVTIYPNDDSMNVECEYISGEQLNEIQSIVQKYGGLNIFTITPVDGKLIINIC